MATEEQIIEGCKNYNKVYQKQLYDLYAPAMRCICYRYTQTHYEADDLLQEGFLKVFSKIRQYRNEGAFCTWIKRIFVNTAISAYRKKLKRQVQEKQFSIETDLTENELDDKDLLIDELTMHDISLAIGSLNQSARLILNLFLIEEYSHKEIADILNISVENSKIRVLRGKKELRKVLLQVVKTKAMVI